MDSFNINAASRKNILGLMSGTSCDGLDIAWVEIEGSGIQTKLVFKAGKSFDYPQQLKTSLLAFMRQSSFSAKDFSQLNFYLAQIWAGMVKQFLRENKLSPGQIDLIGSHGQTIWHQPQSEPFIDRQTASTLQLGDPSVLAQLRGIPVAGDFRTADMALGGQGAPLIPYFDWVWFSQFSKNILAVNIGGISNLTIIPADGSFKKVAAFDCGPGNMLIDGAMQELFAKPFDENGAIAFSGDFSQDLFDRLLQKDTFISQKPPKSTGREFYGEIFLRNILSDAQKLNLKNEDVINTLGRFTAFSIYQNYHNFIAPSFAVQAVTIGGGGAHNRFIMDSLQELFGDIPVSNVKAFNLDEDFKEAIGFAVLANETWQGNFSNVPQVTGAVRPAVLGKICLV